MKRIWGAWLVALMLAACGGDDDGGGGGGGDGGGGGGGGASKSAGIGPSTDRPEGTPFVLPEGLTLQKDPIQGIDRNDCYPKEQKDRPRKGSGDMVRLCVHFTNSTPNPITVQLPAGLIFVSFDTETQNGLLIQVETFEVPSGEYAVELSLYCLNKGRHVSSPGDDFELGPLVDAKDPVWELINLLKDKSLTVDNQAYVQGALWSITDEDGLTKDDLERINAL